MPTEVGIFNMSWDTGIRTPIKGFKGLCPTIRRYPNVVRFDNTMDPPMNTTIVYRTTGKPNCKVYVYECQIIEK